MARLIDADALHTSLVKMNDFGELSAKKAIRMVSKAPTVDAEPVIRCKDCKHRDPEDKKCDNGHSILWQLPREDDWYCADAERKSE